MSHDHPHGHHHGHDHHHDQPFEPAHSHVFLGERHDRNARRTMLVIALTTAMMVIEIVAGTIYGSMALVADGWHMSTHAAAMLIAALAYVFARRQAHNPRFTFGTGKVGDLAAFASAVILAIVAIYIGWESVARLMNPVAISFREAAIIAVVGLAVNLASAWLLHDGGHHGHGHDHDHAHGHGHGHDNNLRAAYVHVLADALTSVLAIFALVMGAIYGLQWIDPAMGIVGAVVIARWSWTLIRDAGRVLVDYVPSGEDLPDEIREAVETDRDVITDLHVWQVGPGHHAAIVALKSSAPATPESYKSKLAHIHDLSHVTIEVQPA
ncbi:cation diffusion facilitator family transporter [Aminobacter niigataensis]|uniref:Cation diffusion facilitator family transporter n=1 Tax=Aminobacter niigataensis TaxID=83265 RepID=A0ABR6L3D3_9HYPH|nr:CDF family Co(II)/Ni(II) efflux transporter DmeF [Aminobacter niigataensis]MBB4650536.1 cation diffusion facilitator family transporter [Aminobacter niigataensis]